MLPHLHLVANSTIIALSTPPGTGALAIIRMAGPDTFSILDQVFRGKRPSDALGYTILYGHIQDPETKATLDEVLVSVFRAPHSYTKEDAVEISCHGAPLIVRQVISLLCRLGAVLAQPGEFTLRAYKHGRFDLAQAEAVADLIHAETEAAQRMAFSQMRGGFSKRLSALREKLIHFASLIELELDFGEEDVEFANRQDLKDLLGSLLADIGGLISSFSTGNALKNGVPVVIAGRPNAGKSTLLNALLQDERALVSDIPGTTRDTVEDTIVLGGLQFRFIDTAGLRETTDVVEAMGVSRTLQKMQDAQMILYMLDLHTTDYGALITEAQSALIPLLADGKQVILVGNKVDDVSTAVLALYQQAFPDLVLISALNNLGLDVLTVKLINTVQLHLPSETDVVVSNLRHVEALRLAEAALERALTGLHNGLTGDFLALDIRHGLYHLGEITGEITTDDLLGNIFSRFCIGK